MTKPKLKEPDTLFDAEPKTRPLTEGKVRKGGRNTFPSQVKERPAAPAPIAKAEPSKEVVALPTRIQPANLLTAIAQAASDPNCQPEKMHALLDARDRLMAQEAHVAFVSAYIDMQAELPTIRADGKIEIAAKRDGAKKQSTPYATFQNIMKVVGPILKQHKFAMMMLPDIGESGAGVLMRGQLGFVCDTQYGRMVHVERCAITAPLETSGSKNNVQGVGSSLSYTKRYCAVALLNIISEAVEDRDDDARAAGKPTNDRVTDDQLREIVELATEIACPPERLIAHLNSKLKYPIAEIGELPASRFGDAIAALRSYENNRKAREAGGGQ